MFFKKLSLFFSAVFLLLSACNKHADDTSIEASSGSPHSLLQTFVFPKPTGLVSSRVAAVSARAEVSEIGVEIMRKGGNAFDAMVAMEMALGVAFPFAGGPGGGGFAVYRLANGEVGALDFREKAPLAAHETMYLDDAGKPVSRLSREGATSVGVPGTVAGVFAMHERFGTMPIAELFRPAIELAESGFTVTEYQAKQMARSRSKIAAISGEDSKFSSEIPSGTVLQRKALARTLRAIAEGGRDAFYKGEIAKKIARFVQEKGGIITEEDLARYETVWRKPIVFNYKGLSIISMSPPSSGGITLQQIMGMIEPYDLKSFGHNSPMTMQILVEAERRAYADRNFFLGDPDFVDIPYAEMTDPAYLRERMSSFNKSTATLSENVRHGNINIVESQETTHYSIVDSYGNAVAVTMTINGAYGSKLFDDELGFFYNNEMDDFSAKPGTPNQFGLIGSKANRIEPEKRMLSSMSPTIVTRDGELLMVLGSPGGSTIITSVLQTILNVYEFGMSMQDAVNAPRFHHQWVPDVVFFEHEGFDPDVMEQLKSIGYNARLGWGPVIGKVDAILHYPDGTLESGADRRGDDSAAGF